MKELYPWQVEDWSRLRELGKRPVHGLVFRGSRGTGKLDLAIGYAQSLLCQRPSADGFACGSCPSCHWFEQGTHPDFRMLQPEALNPDTEGGESGKRQGRDISVDQIRGLADFFGMTAHQGGRRVIVIHPADTMNVNAANALLKNLEEPPPGLLFVLVTDKPQRLLPTILSRCLSVALSAPDIPGATRWLQQLGVKNPAGSLAASGFAPLLAARPDQQLGGEERDRLLRAVRQPAILDAFALADELQKTEQLMVVQWLQQWCYDLSAMKFAGRLRYHTGEEAIFKKLSGSIAPLNLARLHTLLNTAKREARHTLNPKLFLESLLLAYRQLMLE